MKNTLVGAILLLLLAFTLPARQGACEAQTPEQLVRDFYAWYFKADEGPVAAENKDEIYNYVTEKAVKYIKRRPLPTVSYFAKANTFNAIWTNPEIIVGKAISMAGDMFVVPVTFKLRWEDYREDYHVVVYVLKESGIFRIVKVSDIYSYS